MFFTAFSRSSLGIGLSDWRLGLEIELVLEVEPDFERVLRRSELCMKIFGMRCIVLIESQIHELKQEFQAYLSTKNSKNIRKYVRFSFQIWNSITGFRSA